MVMSLLQARLTLRQPEDDHRTQDRSGGVAQTLL